MQRYGSPGGYRGRRRRSHPIRNTLILLLSLLVGGAVLASTEVGASLLGRVGIPNPLQDTQVAQVGRDPKATAGTESTSAPAEQATEGDPSSVPTDVAGSVPTSQEGAQEVVVTAPPGVPGVGATAQPAAPTQAPTQAPTPAPTASPMEVAQAYLQNWQAGRYGEMHKLLSDASRQQYDLEYFEGRYTGIAREATIQSVAPKLRAEAQQQAERDELLLRLPFDVKIGTRVVGDINETNLLTLVKENNSWRVQWSPSLIFKDLSGDNLIRRADYPAPRGSIFDREGKPLAIDGSIVQVGVVPAQIQNEKELLTKLSAALGVSRKFVQEKYQGREPSYFWPVRDISRDRVEQVQKAVGGVAGVQFGERPGRQYPQNDVMAQVIGYVTNPFAEDLAKPEYADYSETDVIGRGGLEQWGQQYLRGEPGGKLSVVTPDEVTVKVIKEKPYRPGHNIYLNIDLDLQVQAERELGGRPGAVVALDPNNGEILALVSQPSYDLNKFVVGISQEEFARLNSKEANNPFQERAASSSFPLASAFKPITTSAALTLKLPNLDRTWFSDGTWDKLGESQVRRDWKPGGHGYVTLIDGITESVDTIYYDLGYELYQKCYDCLSEHSRKWMLGRRLGVDGIPNEAAGQVPGPGVPFPGWGPGDNVNLAIGQGALRTSPLQAAFLYATIGNGGTMYRPHLINRIVAAENSSQIIKQWKPASLGKAPASPETIRFLQQGLRTVTNDEMGTAYDKFKDSPISVAGKTGTGQQDKKDPFAWFAGYAPATSPKVTVVALAENAGEGSEIAAPIVRKVMEFYLKPPVARP